MPVTARHLAVALACSCWTSPHPVAPHRDQVRIGLDVGQLVLSNGLPVVIVSEPNASEVSLTLRYGVGSADDPPGREGLAHVVEHVLFEHVRAGETLGEYLDAHALDHNGFTTFASTTFVERAVPAALGDLLELEAARLEMPCREIPATAFETQREIVRAERREHEAARQVIGVVEQAMFAPTHPLGGGRAESDGSISAITQDQACGFEAAHYGPRNGVLVLSGPISIAGVRPLLDRTLGRVRDDVPRAAAIPDGPMHREVAIDAPVERTWIVLAWPLPADPALRARVRALVDMAGALVQAHVNGIVETVELGAGATRRIAIEIAPSSDISVDLAITGAKHQVSFMRQWFASGLYEFATNHALYELSASLEHSFARDAALAEDVAAGRDAHAAVEAEISALLSMDRGDAAEVASSALDLFSATIVTLRPSHAAGHVVASPSPTLREYPRPRHDDPAEAHKDEPRTFDPTALARGRMRALDNGMQVILLPLSTMPTVDIELMFPAGTADEPAGKRGIALIAAGALHAPSGVATEMLRFVQAGGSVAREATPDHTLFAVQGLAANIDILLDGLSLVVRGGEYDPLSVRDSASWLQLKTQGTVHDRAARVAWRSAVYGSDHPYARAGIWAYADRGATDVDALRAFRAAHYVPDGATLVIAGHFDPHEADRWIDEEFGKWTGHAAERHLPRASPQPFGFALAEDKPEISVAIAIPVDPDARVADELAAEMLQEAISDVREELAASYGLHAYLEETAASTSIVLEGQVDARRAAEVFALVRERIAKLHEPSDDTASIFVSARRHVVARLGSVDTRPAKLAARFVHEADLGLLPGVQLQLAETARVFTIDRLLPALGQLDLGRAAILLRGPRAALDAAYGALGRTPAYIQ